MAIDFPNSPTIGDTHAVGDKVWIYDGEKWLVKSVLAETVSDLEVQLAMQAF